MAFDVNNTTHRYVYQIGVNIQPAIVIFNNQLF